MNGKESVCPQRVAATTVCFQPPAVAVWGLTLAQSVPKGQSIRLLSNSIVK
ncbi:MAG: hypothetical protein J6N79_01300 [Psychrobacter sp.]|nr:hypothetical protein [Psychrobacter sp.]